VPCGRPHLRLPVAQLAELAGMSTFHFIRSIRDAVGEPPAHHLRSLRVAAAQEHLDRSDLTVTEIAYLRGFASSSHLSSAFRACVGTSPSPFRLRDRAC
jgi:AraC family transcriptional regulator